MAGAPIITDPSGLAPPELDHEFSGAKLVLIHGEALLVYRRDNRPDIPFPDRWDLPGGGREGAESPAQCALRELKEEFGLDMDAARICWSRRYRSWNPDHGFSWFLAADLTADEVAGIQFGDEGQYWRLMPIADYLAAEDGIAHHQDRVRDYLTGA